MRNNQHKTIEIYIVALLASFIISIAFVSSAKSLLDDDEIISSILMITQAINISTII